MKVQRRRHETAAEVARALPAYCDHSCRHAAFAPPETVGACRREQAVWCTLFRKFNTKNSHCPGRPS